MSCFMPINSWSSAWVQGRARSGGGAAGIAWRMRIGGEEGAFGLGVNVRGGVLGLAFPP